MAGKIQGITIKFLGDDSDLKRALSDSESKAKSLEAELKRVNTSLKFHPGNADLIAQKQKLLSQEVENTRKKLESLKAIQEQLSKSDMTNPDNERQLGAVQREILKTQDKLKDLQKDLEQTSSKAYQFGESMKKAGSKMTEVGGKAAAVGKDLTMKVTAPIVGAGVASFKMAADFQDAMGATDQIFKGSADQVKAWADSLPTHYGVAKGEALGYANTMGAMLQNIGGMSEEEAAKMSGKLVELAGDLSATFGGSTESAIQALTGALKGNTSMLDNYGMGVNATTIAQKALEMGLVDTGVSAAENQKLMVSVEKAQLKYNEAVKKFGPESIQAKDASANLDLANQKLTESSNKISGELSLEAKQAAILGLVMEQTGQAQGQAGREASGASGQQKALMTELKNGAVEIGTMVMPMFVQLIGGVRDLVQWFANMSPETQNMIVNLLMVAAVVGPIILIIGKIVSVIGLLSSGIGTLITFFSAGGAGAVAFSAVVAAIGPFIGPVLIVIGALIGILFALKTHFGSLQNAIKYFTENIPIWINNFVQAVIGFFTNLWDSAVRIFTNIKESVTSKFNELKTNATTAIENLLSSAREKVNSIKTAFTNGFDAIKTAVSDKIRAAKDAFNTSVDAIKSKATTIIDGIKTVFRNGIDFLKGLFNFSWELPRIKLPHFTISGSFSLNPPSIPYLGVEWYDKGGIFTNPAIIGVGEKRPEFVGALDDLKDIVRGVISEYNTGVQITGNTFVVREEADIKKIAVELERLRIQKRRGGY